MFGFDQGSLWRGLRAVPSPLCPLPKGFSHTRLEPHTIA